MCIFHFALRLYVNTYMHKYKGIVIAWFCFSFSKMNYASCVFFRFAPCIFLTSYLCNILFHNFYCIIFPYKYVYVYVLFYTFVALFFLQRCSFLNIFSQHSQANKFVQVALRGRIIRHRWKEKQNNSLEGQWNKRNCKQSLQTNLNHVLEVRNGWWFLYEWVNVLHRLKKALPFREIAAQTKNFHSWIVILTLTRVLT